MGKQILTIGLPNETVKIFDQYFEMDHYSLMTSSSFNEAMIHLERHDYCMIILNVFDESSDKTQSFVSRIRMITYAPLLVLTKLEMIAATLEVGADACVPSTTSLRIIFSQAMALLRRYIIYDCYDAFDPEASTLYRGDLIIDSKRHRVTKGNAQIYLRPREFRLLAYFARNPGIVLTQDQIREAVWLDEADEARDITPVITYLRKKLDDDKERPKYIETVRGVGYRFLPES